eukprot:m.22088 g.22088  ORF g.22088 m.22088 type:complete len:190 (+) comp5421_c0_seq1:79-648(+)
MGQNHGKLQRETLEQLSEDTKFSKIELEQWHKAFLRDCPSGSLSKEGFASIYSQFFPHGDPSVFSNIVFDTFDEDGNGTIDFREFMCALSITGRGSPEEKLEWTFKLYDLDGDKTITKKEMLHIVSSIFKMVNKDVAVAEEDTPERRVDHIFEIMDTNKDGVLTLEEFQAGAKQDPTILKAISLYDGLV